VPACARRWEGKGKTVAEWGQGSMCQGGRAPHASQNTEHGREYTHEEHQGVRHTKHNRQLDTLSTAGGWLWDEPKCSHKPGCRSSRKCQACERTARKHTSMAATCPMHRCLHDGLQLSHLGVHAAAAQGGTSETKLPPEDGGHTPCRQPSPYPSHRPAHATGGWQV
jgi:hypothetical protein